MPKPGSTDARGVWTPECVRQAPSAATERDQPAGTRPTTPDSASDAQPSTIVRWIQADRSFERLAAGTSRRGFLARVGAAVVGLAGARTAGALVAPGEAEAYHFCGHIYSTDSCPHPTGLPRIDRRGFPLRAQDGHRVDDLGRLVDADERPVDEDGRRLTDVDGRPLPRATRTRVCTAAGEAYGIDVRTDGAWYRCCGGQVRKLVDCCSTSSRRINGDRALRGYCFENRKVFCVMYYDTRVRC